MKAKVKFDLGAIKNWLLEHGEKVAFGVILLVFLMFTWGAISREVLEESKQPNRLDETAKQVISHVERASWDPKVAGVHVVEYDKRAKKNEVAAAEFEALHPLNPALGDPRAKRGEPKLLAAEEPIATAGNNVFALSAESDTTGVAPSAGGGKAAAQSEDGYRPQAKSKLRPTPWVAVTALVPKLRQEEEYSAAFAKAQGEDKDADHPTYRGYILERAEVAGATDTALDKLKWQRVKPSDAFIRQWEGLVPDELPSACVNPVLTGALGPLVGSPWSDSVMTHPKIVEDLEAPAAKSPQAEVAEKAEAKDNDKPEESRWGFGGAAARRGPEAQAPPAPAAAAAATNTSERPPLKYELLRVFDFSVEPMKSYRYRVKLGVQNPNFQKPAKYLKNPTAAKAEVLETEWSEPTNIVSIPDAHRLFAGEFNPKSFRSDPTAKVLITAVDEQEGVEAAAEIEVSRGAVASTDKREATANDPRGGLRELPNVDFKTGRLVLDIRGGRSFSTRKDPALANAVEVLVLDPLGNLSVRSELDDEAQYHAHLPPEPKEAAVQKEPPKTKSNRKK